MLKNKFLYLLIFSTTLLGQEINKETLSQLEEMIMSDPATQALIVSHKGEIVLESYGKEDSREDFVTCLLYTSPSPRDRSSSRMPSSA